MSEEMVCRKRRLSSFANHHIGLCRGNPAGRAAADVANFCDSSVCNAVS